MRIESLRSLRVEMVVRLYTHAFISWVVFLSKSQRFMSPTAISRALAENMLCFVQNWNSHRHSRRNPAVATTFIDNYPTTHVKSHTMLDFMGHNHSYTRSLSSLLVHIFFYGVAFLWVPKIFFFHVWVFQLFFKFPKSCFKLSDSVIYREERSHEDLNVTVPSKTNSI